MVQTKLSAHAKERGRPLSQISLAQWSVQGDTVFRKFTFMCEISASASEPVTITLCRRRVMFSTEIRSENDAVDLRRLRLSYNAMRRRIISAFVSWLMADRRHRLAHRVFRHSVPVRRHIKLHYRARLPARSGLISHSSPMFTDWSRAVSVMRMSPLGRFLFIQRIFCLPKFLAWCETKLLQVD